jgi:hypothetical protein
MERLGRMERMVGSGWNDATVAQASLRRLRRAAAEAYVHADQTPRTSHRFLNGLDL